ncbi:MAG: DUF3568 domain-containing protein [Sedimentisphaerales bacterium]|jgi:hypothetical protein|nr:DUF3568 domain-containing protein [Sedimentisphaerales bacterium]
MQKGQVFLVLLLSGVAVLAQGCVVAAVGAGAAGTVAYVRGDLETVETAGLETLYKASLVALDELELAVIQKAKDAMTAEIISRDVEDKKIRIKLNSTAEGMTKLSIRIGMFGDETKSRLIYEAIKKEL